MMLRARAFQAFAISSNVVGVIAALVAAASLVGASTAVWAAIASVGLVLVTSGIGLWYVGRRTRDEYLEAAKFARARGRAKIASEAGTELGDPVVLRKEIVPAFQDAGWDRSRAFFLDLVESLDLKDEEANRERDFVDAISNDPALTTQEKISRLVRHFAPSPSAPHRLK